MDEIGACEIGGGIECRNQNTRIHNMLLHFFCQLFKALHKIFIFLQI